MNISNSLSFIGNILALLALTLKTIYDLILNPRRFHQEISTKGEIEAARAKRNRSDKTTAITFMVLAVSYLILILEAIK